MTAADTSLPRRRLSGLVVLFTATIFLSASLLFFVQPLFARLVLPVIGGAPAVWTTAMLFFQTVLLGGYVYAHLTTRYLPRRAQLGLHLAVWAAALVFLPLAIPEGWSLEPGAPVAFQTLTLFALGVGVPFALLSANAPLLQSWYAGSGGPSADDPYFLYGASNLGSFAALLAFPLVAEPLFGATAIGQGFAAGFVLLGAGLLASGLAAGGGAPARVAAVPTGIAARDLGLWALLAFVPSSLMLAVTTKVSTDVGAMPLVWVIPLALYLLTFTLTFTRRPLVPTRWLALAAALGALYGFAAFLGAFGNHLGLGTAGLLVLAFVAVSLWAHRALYEARPVAAGLTVFYITMSVGGALGGVFNAIVAPSFFDDLHEGPATLALALVLLVTVGRRLDGQAALRGGVVLAVAVASVVLTRPADQLFRDRSFFGTHKVIEQGGLRLYTNGTTVHGAQRLSDLGAARPDPLFYYHREGPMAQAIAAAAPDATIGIVGLGVGSLACYARPGQDWHFYEIDPMVDRVARDPALFGFMSACAGAAPTHLGDARVVLRDQTRHLYDVLVIDAFSSDAVPVHLMTREAVALYMERLAPDGLLLFHISNRYYDLSRPLGRVAADLGLAARLRHHTGDLGNDAGHSGSIVAALARGEEGLAPVAADPSWGPLANDGGRVWTDDFANVLSVLK